MREKCSCLWRFTEVCSSDTFISRSKSFCCSSFCIRVSRTLIGRVYSHNRQCQVALHHAIRFGSCSESRTQMHFLWGCLISCFSFDVAVKFKSVHGALAAFTSDTFTVWSVQLCKSDFYWVCMCPKLKRKHSDYLISNFS